MIQAIRQTTTVRSGGIVEVRSSDLVEGAVAEVIVMVEQLPISSPIPSLHSLVGSCRGVYGDADAIDSYVAGLRDEWEQ